MLRGNVSFPLLHSANRNLSKSIYEKRIYYYGTLIKTLNDATAKEHTGGECFRTVIRLRVQL